MEGDGLQKEWVHFLTHSFGQKGGHARDVINYRYQSKIKMSHYDKIVPLGPFSTIPM